MTEDLTAFFDIGEFADVAIIKASSETLTVNGIFDNGFQEVLGMGGSKPTFLCVESDVVKAKIRHQLAVNSKSYLIAEKEPDGTGLTTITLEKA